MAGYFNRFMEWQNYVHYILGAVFLFIFLGLFFGVWLNFKQFWLFTFAFFVVDSLVHAWFSFTPFKWMRWND